MVAGLVTSVAGFSAHWLPEPISSNAVGLLFFGATYVLVLRGDSAEIARHGLSFGGLFEPVALDPTRLFREASSALLWALAAAAVLLPPFAIGYHLWWQPTRSFEFTPGPNPWSELVTHVAAVALPEEMFYRGYLQTQLRSRWSCPRTAVLADWDVALLVTSVVFALGHVVTIPHPSRLAVFFPSLVFGWLRYRTGGVGASVLFHAACNVFALHLGRGYGLFS